MSGRPTLLVLSPLLATTVNLLRHVEIHISRQTPMFLYVVVSITRQEASFILSSKVFKKSVR